MSKKNIGATLALYPCPVIVVGAMVNDKPTWTLVAHAGTVAHSHLMVSLVQAHYINQGIRDNKKLSVNVVDESWLMDADRMGTISGNKVDKSEAFAWTMGENGRKAIEEKFYQNITFGTAGLRGKVSVGTNCMNYYMVGRATQGVANYIKRFGQEAMDRIGKKVSGKAFPNGKNRDP